MTKQSEWLDIHKTSDGKDVFHHNGNGYVRRGDYEVLQAKYEALLKEAQRND